MLTIAIPTYNRIDILKNNLESLLPQLTDECILLIIDNKSERPVRVELNDLLLKYPEKQINIITNPHNVGLTGNIIKCFELCNSDWLWILGDDDKVVDGAVDRILNDILENKNKVFISYAWDEPSFKRNGNIITNGADELIESIESLGVILFISTSIYNVKKVVQNISFGSFLQTTYAPHLVILFMSLKCGGECILSNRQIVINNSINTPQELKWDQIFIYQLVLLLRMPLNSVTISKLKIRLEELTRLWTISHLIYTLVCLEREDDRMRPIVLYNDIVKSFFYLDRRLLTRIISLLGYILIKHSNIFKPLMLYTYKVFKGKDFNANSNLRI